jgi:ABC-type nitrate/sulfonate/bicarbonate transport system permease component
MTVSQIIQGQRFFRAVDAVACVWWAGMLGLALYRRRFSFGRLTFPFSRSLVGPSLKVDLATRPTAYRVLVAVYAAIVLGLGLAAIFTKGGLKIG